MSLWRAFLHWQISCLMLAKMELYVEKVGDPCFRDYFYFLPHFYFPSISLLLSLDEQRKSHKSCTEKEIVNVHINSIMKFAMICYSSTNGYIYQQVKLNTLTVVYIVAVTCVPAKS